MTYQPLMVYVLRVAVLWSPISHFHNHD